MQQYTQAHELAQWLRLERTPGVGPETARKLLSAFGLPGNIFSATLVALQEVVTERIARILLAPLLAETTTLIERTLVWASQPGNHVLTMADSEYPQALLDTADPPIVLYAKGRIERKSFPKR